MTETSYLRLQFIVFALVSAAFANAYITQPVLPIIQQEFGVDLVLASFTVSAVIFGIALSNLPFGQISDRFAIQPIILVGGFMVAAGGLICAITETFWFLTAARFLQGLFIPALTTCLAAYLAKTLPLERLSIVMGSYVSATVLGGLSGRLLGGWLHPPLHWRYAFVSAAVLVIVATLIAYWGLPRKEALAVREQKKTSYLELLQRWDLLRIYFTAAGSFAVFSSIFNYLPYRLSATPFNFSTEQITLLYLAYVMGIFIGPVSGKLSNRFGSANMLISGSIVFAAGLLLVLIPETIAVVLGLVVICLGFFAVHAAAVGALNRKLSGGQGRANALYVLFYYLGGWLGITGAGFAYKLGGWLVLVFGLLLILGIPLMAGVIERKTK